VLSLPSSCAVHRYQHSTCGPVIYLFCPFFSSMYSIRCVGRVSDFERLSGAADGAITMRHAFSNLLFHFWLERCISTKPITKQEKNSEGGNVAQGTCIGLQQCKARVPTQPTHKKRETISRNEAHIRNPLIPIMPSLHSVQYLPWSRAHSRDAWP
jgi:hypothetical protein